MKRKIAWILVPALLLLSAPTLWADSPPARFGHSMVNINGNIYLFGGLVPGNPNPKNDLWEYNSEGNNWSEVFAQGSAPPGRHSHTATAIDGKMYVVGGMNAMYQPQSDSWEYDAEADIWEEVLAANPPPACAFQGATGVGDQLVIFGGIVTGGTPSSETWVYDTVASSWTQGQDFPGVGYGDSMASHNGKALVIGHTEGEIYVYDVALDTWTTVPATGGTRSTITATGDPGVPPARVLALTAQTSDTAWLLGGEDVNTADTLGDAWALDLTTLTWTPCEPVDPIRHSAMAVIGMAGALAPGRLKAGEAPVQLLIFSGLNASGQVTDKQIIYDPAAPPATLPTVTTQAVTNIGTTTATGNGNITDLGSTNPTQHGVCWNTTGTPTIADSNTQEGPAAATGAFTSNMTGLSSNATYYVRAYATNTAGTSYGNQVSFSYHPTPIPTLNEWGLIILSLLLIGIGYITIRRWKRASV